MSENASRPVIGVSAYVEPVDRSVWVQQPSAVLPHRYLDHLERAGAIAVILPPRHDADDDMARCRARPARRPRHRRRGRRRVRALRRRAAPDLAGPAGRPRRVGARPVARVARRGTCRCWASAGGCRSWPSRRAAALVQHVPDVVGHEAHCPRPGEYATHHATPVEGTRLAELLGTEPLDVPTYHHQAVRPESLEGTAYRPSAWHADGTLEAMEDPRHPASGWRCSGTRRRATTGGCSTPSWPRPRQASVTSERAVRSCADREAGPGDNRPMTKLNRLAIAAGAASALGALAAAGKGVNDAHGRATCRGAARAGAAVPGLPGGRLPQHLARHLVDAVGPARRAAPVP